VQDSERNDSNVKLVEDYRTLKIATHNVNGLKGNSAKLELLLEWANREKVDMIGINETNITGRHANYSMRKQENFLGIWTDAEENKKKGSGVGLIMNKKWEKHLSQVERSSAYCIEALFVFKKQKLLVIVVYIPHNDQKIRKEIQQQVIRRSNECSRKSTNIIILGDFNDIRNRELDQSREDSKRKQKLPLLAWLGNSSLIDAFRKVHPYEKKFTRMNSIVNSRIDYIWVSRKLGQGLMYCDITEASTITNSDHAIVVTKLVTGIMKRTRTQACNKRLKGKQWAFQLNKANEENWEEYKSTLDSMLKEKLKSRKVEEHRWSEELQNIDELWDLIATSITRSAKIALPGKKVLAENTKLKQSRDSDKIKKDLKKIGSICQLCSKNIGHPITNIKRLSTNDIIFELNSTYNIEIEVLIEELWTKERHDELKIWWKTIYTKLQQERKKEDLKEINIAVEHRCEAIQGELKHMLSSLLERSSKRVVIDRLVKKDSSDIVLVNQREEVLEEVRSHFKKQFRKRNSRAKNMSKKWKEIYTPIEDIRKEVYEDLMSEITEEEWTEALRKAKLKSAPGPSNISYPLIKRAGPFAQKVFRQLANICLKKGEIPIKWKLSKLYPIPKGEDWNFNLNNVRPIILLEAFRKTVVRIITYRLDKVIVEHNILQGPNYAGLSGDSTASPIHILNNILEDARQKNNELWILFQDMRKAFDSVSLEMLEKALKRIKLPEVITKFILGLFEKRKIKIITSYGLTNEFEAEDGIDQGEVISPLVWRIFYDPLLCAIQNTRDTGYRMSTNWPTDLVYNKTKELYHQQAVLAYADDTTWIARSKKELQEIVNVSNEFYELNDIEINSKKSELLVLNSINKKSANQKSMSVNVGKSGDKVYAKKDASTFRHLGVWISHKDNQKHSINIIKDEISRMCKAVKWKKATASQLVYLNNNVLLPSIEYRLQTNFLSKSICDRIQRPIWSLIKNKLELACTTANSICSHKGFLGLRSIWQNQLAHHFTELTLRINRQEVLGKTTKLRLKEGQLQSKSLLCPSGSKYNFDKVIPKNNLTLKVMHEGAKLDFRINEIVENLDDINIVGTEISKLLGKKEMQSYAKTDKMNLFVIEQLIDSAGSSLLTWQQTKYIRSFKKKGRTPSWFLKLEEIVLKENNDRSSRELKDIYKVKSPNRRAIKLSSKKISNDRRKKEWFLFKKDKHIHVGKVVKKTEKGVVAEHWKEATHPEEREEAYEKCKGCGGKRSSDECLINIKYKEWHQVVDTHVDKDKLKLEAPITALLEEKEIVEKISIEQEINIEITAHDVESAIIQEVVDDKGIQEELIKLKQKLKGREIVEFYTDGAMTRKEGGANSNSMGIGWVVKEENRIEHNINFSCRLENWPSSTRAELGAIWSALLTAPVNAQVHIRTDSKAAIEAIEKHQMICKLRNWFKTKNRSIIRQILDCCKAKNLSLFLHKVKGHSGIIENDLADEFAKKGLSRINVLNIPETSYKDLKYVPKWKDKSIDNSLRSFVNITTAIAYETEWSNLHNMVEVTNQSQDNNNLHNKLIWSNIWQILKKLQGKKCTSLKKSKALIFRIKCINDILPTKDICYQRNPKLYKSKKCIACFCADETMYHIAECEVYQKIWKNLEEEAIQLTRLEVLSKLDILLNENIF
jgi:exonuclease III